MDNPNPKAREKRDYKKPEVLNQAERVVQKFGGARQLARILKRVGRPKHPASIFRWTYPREKGGTGGIIPTAAWPDLIHAARIEGVVLTAEDMDVREAQLIPARQRRGWAKP